MNFPMNLFRGKVIKFYPYPSTVVDRVFEINYANKEIDSNEFMELMKEMISFAKDCDVKSSEDNKIVFEVELYSGKKIFFGFHDWVFSIGFEARTF